MEAAKHKSRLRQLIRDHFGALAERPVQNVVNLEDVLKAVKPLVEANPTTAKLMISFLGAESLRGPPHINFAIRRSLNPASWQGVLRFVMAKLKAGGHHAAMPYAEVPAFVKSLRAIDNVYARVCELTILCWSRRDETRMMRWHEVDFEKCVLDSTEGAHEK